MKRLFATLTFLFLLGSFTAIAQTTEANPRVSPNFSTFKGVLLIQSDNVNVINKTLEKRFSKFYKGEFEMIKGDDLTSGSYNNAKTYPFVINFVHTNHIGNTDFYKFIMTDRTTGNTYQTQSSPDNTIPGYSMMNSYAKELEELRSK